MKSVVETALVGSLAAGTAAAVAQASSLKVEPLDVTSHGTQTATAPAAGQ